MIYECAPMDGVTDFIFRQVQSRHFEQADLYYTPFLSLTAGHGFQEREYNEMDPEHNRGMLVIPQLIGNREEDLLWGIREIADLGYREVNLNMGCPSNTVTRKSKGAGMLRTLSETERILDRVYENTPIKVSLKVRIGFETAEEFPAILNLLNRYPASKIILHPRVSRQGYGGEVNLHAWELAMRECRAPLSYSGDLFDPECIRAFRERYPSAQTLMLGRGMVANPNLPGEARGSAPLDTKRFREYHGDLYESYGRHLIKERYVICRMKELWAYMGMSFSDRDKQLLDVRRARTFAEYEEAAERLISTCPIRENAGFIVPDQRHADR